jgi:hypothetical protein
MARLFERDIDLHRQAAAPRPDDRRSPYDGASCWNRVKLIDAQIQGCVAADRPPRMQSTRGIGEQTQRRRVDIAHNVPELRRPRHPENGTADVVLQQTKAKFGTRRTLREDGRR